MKKTKEKNGIFILTKIPFVGKIKYVKNVGKDDFRMKKTFSIRKIDNLGRIVIPMDFRKALEICEWDDLRISLEGNAVTIRKDHDTCTFCGSEKKLTAFGDKFICEACLSKLKEV